ncbi:hypothetical protein ANACAC_02800 [Anaerostipes caccae L1-92]|uniref:Uncharacterized protein n=1 Tax=Anaerostipes caccae (strain DSM 14662 / CCUG 47493 / JCM 13470 / NCIMB 13811 / L1-92) TaxID=411490 RepID=B0MH38_ANACD|nr:hypothetical protein ANACAC_02800 [Anaerostipes caccae L1-92]
MYNFLESYNIYGWNNFIAKKHRILLTYAGDFDYNGSDVF